jgi:FHS family L-fucose permease-like MFS transporter
MIGRFVGTWLLTRYKANRLLATYAVACVILVAYAMMASGISAIVAISLTYFFMSIMFPTIFALSIKDLGQQVKLGSGLVIMAIVGGAVLPPITGWISLAGLQYSLIVPFISFLVIMFFGMAGYKVRPS